jgi:hypothetical protein
MLNKIFKLGLMSFLSLVIITTTTSCQKEKETIGIIVIKDSNGNLVQDVTVTLFPEQIVSSQGNLPDPSLTKTNNTDANGEAQFTYDLEVILQIEAIKEDGNSTYTGANIIRLQKGKTITKIVEIN